MSTVKSLIINLPPLIKPIWLAKFVINTLLSRQENYTRVGDTEKSTCEQRVGILTFCHHYMVTYIFQAFIMFSQLTGALVELLCFDHIRSFNILPQGATDTAEQGGNYFLN